MHDDLKTFFAEPANPKQRQYEALRAYVLEQKSAQEAADMFGFTRATLYSLANDLRSGKLDFFPKQPTGPKTRRITPYVRDLILELRKEKIATTDIVDKLKELDVYLSLSTVERVLNESGFGKLHRRTDFQRGVSKKNTNLPIPAQNLNPEELKPFRAECQIAGIFFFLPYILESGIVDVLDKLPLPQSNRIGRIQAGLSFLLLKLIGGERLSHVRQYDHDRGFGLFAGLNSIPKPTYMSNYSCLLTAELCHQFQEEIVTRLTQWEPSFFSGKTINLDFHSIPHFGDQSEMEKVWCGARNKALKGANTFFAQDAETKAVLYANADILRKDGASEVLQFVEYWNTIKPTADETLVFESRLTTYHILGELDRMGVKFITLRTRSKNLAEQTELIPDSNWQKVTLPIPKRKYQKFLACESDVNLNGCDNALRQIIMKDHGRGKPTYIITNNRSLKLEDVLAIYVRRWRIENKLSELIRFFNINALSSPIMIRIHFDLLLSITASFLYQRFAADLPRFEKNLAPDIFRRFVNMPGWIEFDGDNFEVQIRKRAHTPVLLGVPKLQKPMEIPWLGGKKLGFSWLN